MKFDKLIFFWCFLGVVGAVGYAASIAIENASQAQINLVQTALGDQYPIIKTAVVKSSTHKQAYYIGATFKAVGAGNIKGIWLISGTKNAPGLLFSVDGAAYQFSGMRKASDTKAGGSVIDPESKLLLKYLPD